MPAEQPDESIQPAADVVGLSAQSGGERAVPPGPPLPDLSHSWVEMPWSGLVVFCVWFAGEVCVMVVAGALLAARSAPEGAAPDSSEQQRLGMWAALLALPIRLAAGVFLVRAFSPASLEEMGLTARGLSRNVLLGVALALPLALAVYGVQEGCEALSKQFTPALVVREHPFTKLARQGLTTTEWGVLIAAALLAAPVWEEFLFRGLIQPWTIARRWGGPIVLGLAVACAVLLRSGPLGKAWRGGGAAVLIELIPAAVALGMVPIYLLLRAGLRSPVPAAVFAAAVLFGWFHVQVWPSPIALTLLGVGLGALAWRTRSLAGPIALHASFNAIAVVVLMLEPWWRG